MMARFPIVVTAFVLLCGVVANGQQRTPHVVKTVVGPWIEKSETPGVIVVVHREGSTEFFPF